MNKLFIIGNLTRDPELRSTQGGIPVCTFTVAVNQKMGKDSEQADFFRVTAWRALAETCNKYLTKGRKVAVVGTVGVSAYTAKGGEHRTQLEVTAQDVEFLGGAQHAAAQTQQDQQSGFVQVDDEELPF